MKLTLIPIGTPFFWWPLHPRWLCFWIHGACVLVAGWCIRFLSTHFWCILRIHISFSSIYLSSYVRSLYATMFVTWSLVTLVDWRNISVKLDAPEMGNTKLCIEHHNGKSHFISHIDCWTKSAFVEVCLQSARSHVWLWSVNYQFIYFVFPFFYFFIFFVFSFLFVRLFVFCEL